MPINKFESILKCPITHTSLSWLTENELNHLNQRIQHGEMILCHGEVFTKPLKGALKAKDHELYYPVQDDIFYLLAHCALFYHTETPKLINPKVATHQVKKFYDDFGWQQCNGIYQDAKDSEDLRAVSQEYIQRCHLRLNKFIPKSGQYILDVACGPIQYSPYLTYSENFEYRICADISIQALLEAKKKLGKKGIYLLCDVTELPLKDNVIDAGVSLHTIYHVPAQEQAQAFAELYRVLKPEGVSIVVYSWGSRSLLMILFLLPLKVISWIKKKIHAPKSLYFYAHSYRWFCQEIQSKYKTKLYVWRSVNVPFLKMYIHYWLGGHLLLRMIYALEERFPQIMGKMGAYPLFVSKKS